MQSAQSPAGAVFIAGGSGGVGAAITQEFARRGLPVAFTYHRNAAKAEQLLASLAPTGVEAAAYQLDLTGAEATTAALNEVVARFGGLHSVIYAAGPAFEMGFVSQLSPKAWADVFATDVNGCFNLFSAALAHMRRQRRGNLLALTTCALKRPPKADVLSAAPKAAIDMLIKCIAKEEGPAGIRANTVELGFINAGIAARHIEYEWSAEMIQGIKTATPLRRFGEAKEIARAVAFLCSEDAGFITGQSLAVDGGYQL
jgi:NAD(P)-dependent dehydrogenase (short-subunit alcohol dehydrogenase family)